MTIEFSSASFPANFPPIYYAASKDRARYSMQGIHVDPSRGFAECTDGRILARIPVASKVADDAPLDSIIDVNAFKTAQRSKRPFLVQNKPVSGAEIFQGASVTSGCWVDGKFPKADQVIPEDSGEKIHLNGEYLVRLLKAIGGDKACVSIQVPKDTSSPIRIDVFHSESDDERKKREGRRIELVEGAIGVIMPITRKVKSSQVSQ